MKPHQIIQELGTQRGRLFKESVLSNFLHDKEFQQGLDMALSPFTTFGVAKIPISKQDGFGMPFDQFKEDLAEKLISREVTGNKARELIQEHMEYATKELERIADALEEILRLVKKDMKTMREAARPEKRPTIQ